MRSRWWGGRAHLRCALAHLVEHEIAHPVDLARPRLAREVRDHPATPQPKAGLTLQCEAEPAPADVCEIDIGEAEHLNAYLEVRLDPLTLGGLGEAAGGARAAAVDRSLCKEGTQMVR